MVGIVQGAMKEGMTNVFNQFPANSCLMKELSIKSYPKTRCLSAFSGNRLPDSGYFILKKINKEVYLFHSFRS